MTSKKKCLSDKWKKMTVEIDLISEDRTFHYSFTLVLKNSEIFPDDFGN